MDVLEFLRNKGSKSVPNPNYNSKSKKNIEPPFISIPNIVPNYDPFVETNRTNLENQYSVSAKDIEKYRKIGLNWNPREAANGSLDRQLADSQSSFSKFKNALEQAVVSEVGLGTLKGFSDLVDAVGQAIGASDHDYSNPVSRKLEEWQDKFNNDIAPVYTTPSVDIAHGGFTDAGWWASNIPSIMSSLTLLLPSTGVTKGLSALGKAAKVGQGINKVGRLASAPAKWAARATKLSDTRLAQKTYAGLKELTTLSSATKAQLGLFAEVGTNAALSRTMENFQEARQVYDDMYQEVGEALNGMSDKEYADFLERNKSTIGNIDASNKDEVAKAVARESADRTFRYDYANTIFDIIELYGLRNLPFRGFRNERSSVEIRRLQRNSIRYAGMTPEEIVEAQAKRTFRDKAAENIGDYLTGGKWAIASQLSEGVEEAVNYIAQQEGMNVGHAMFGIATTPTFAKRLNEYMQEAGLWESAFWGLAGGVVFQGLGSQFNRLSNAIENSGKKSRRIDPTTGESVQGDFWREIWETKESKRRKADIESRNQDFNDYLNNLDLIVNRNKNPFQTDENGEATAISDNEKDMLIEKAYTDMLTKMTLRAMDSGNFDLLKEYLASNEVRDAIVNSGLVNQNQATQYQQAAIAKMEKIEKQYDDNVVALNNISKKLRRKGDAPIPIEYLQIIARNNINHQLKIEDWQAQVNAWEAEGSELQQQFADKLDPNVNYKSAVRLVFLTQQLGQLEAEKKELQQDKARLKTIAGQQELEDINTNINTVRDIIYNLEPDNAVSNLLFAIQNALSYEKKDGVTRSVGTSEDYQNIRRRVIAIERNEDSNAVEEADKYLTSLDSRLAGFGSSEAYRTQLLDDNIRRAYDTTRGLDKIAGDLHEAYFRLADLQTAIALERQQIMLTEDEVSNEANKLNNFMNEVRKNAIINSEQSIVKLADKYGTDVVKAALFERYNNNKLKEDYFGDTAEDIANGKIFNDALDVLHLNYTPNRPLFGQIESILDINEQIRAAQNQNTSTSEETISEPQNLEVNPSSAEPTETNTVQMEQKNTNIPQTETQSADEQQTSENDIITLTKNGNVYARLTPSDEGDGTYNLDIIPGTPQATSLLNDEDFYTKNGVSLTEDFLVSEKPVVERNKNGQLIPRRKGMIVKATDDNVARVEEENTRRNKDAPSSLSTGDVVLPVVPPVPSIDITQPTNTEEVLDKNKPKDFDIENEASKEVQLAVRDAILKDVDLDFDELKQNILNKYLDRADDKQLFNNKVNHLINSFKKIHERKRKNQSTPVDDVVIRASSITEKTRNKNLIDDFHKAVDKLMEKYRDDVALDYIDGKYYLRLDDLLRYCNEQVGHNSTAALIYQSLTDYIRATPSKYVIIDGNLSDVLNRVSQSKQTRLNNLNVRNTLYGINFDGYLASLDKEDREKVLDVIDSLTIGDKIEYKTTNTGVTFSVNGTTIGFLPMPKIGTRGERWQYNDGWRTDVLDNGDGTISSKLKDLFKSWIAGTDNPDIKEINELAIKAAFTRGNKAELAKQFMINPEVKKAKANGFISENADEVEILEGIAKIWNYTRQLEGLTREETEEIRTMSIDAWFDTQVKPSFDMVETLNSRESGSVVVGSINEGEFIDGTITNGKLLPAQQAIGEKQKGKVRIAAAEEIGTLLVAGNGVAGQPTLSFSGIAGAVGSAHTVAVFPSKSGRHGYANAYPQTIASNQLGKDAKALVNAIYAEINRIGTQQNTRQVGEELESFLMQLLNHGDSNHTPLFRIKSKYGISSYVDKDSGEKLGFSLNYYDENKVAHNIKVTWKIKTKTGAINGRSGLNVQFDGGDNSIVVSNNTQEAINYIKDFLGNNARFNIGYGFIRSDSNTSMHLNSLAHRDEQGRFVITIPNQGSFTFDSFNDFVLNNNVVSLATEPGPNQNNYNRQTTVGNQAANQNIKVRLEEDSQSPVESSNDVSSNSTQTTVQQVLDILNNKERNAGRRIAKLIYGQKAKNIKISNKIFDLFPKSIIFVDENIGSNALSNAGNAAGEANNPSKTILQPGQVLVGREWLSLVSGNVAQQKQAVRKLVHEQLHVILHKDGNQKYIEQIRYIFDQFVKNNTNIELDKYQFKDNKDYRTKDGHLNEAGLEEFLVESLTSEELAAGLNAIKIETDINGKKIKESLLQKIMRSLAKMFGWHIEKGSLYEEEFSLLRDMLSEDETTSKDISEISSDNQNYINVDESVTEETTEEKADETNDELFFGDEFTNLFKRSTITEHPNVTSFVNSLSIDQQIDIIEKIDKGEIETKCK